MPSQLRWRGDKKTYIFNGNNCLWFQIYKKYSIVAIYYIFWVDSHTSETTIFENCSRRQPISFSS
jgi:hypothetical protein